MIAITLLIITFLCIYLIFFIGYLLQKIKIQEREKMLYLKDIENLKKYKQFSKERIDCFYNYNNVLETKNKELTILLNDLKFKLEVLHKAKPS